MPNSEGRRMHAKEKMTTEDGTPRYVREFEDKETSMVLVRILVGRVESMERLSSVLRSVPVKVAVPGWDCVSWVREALEALEKDGKALGTSKTDRSLVRDTAMQYVEQKKLLQGKKQFPR
jgi:hypothetical protein